VPAFSQGPYADRSLVREDPVLIAGLSPEDSLAYVRDWLLAAGQR
jgi:hypothetical protein